MTESEARALLEATGLNLTIHSEYLYSSTVPLDDVIRMEPPAGTLVEPNSLVTLFVSLGAAPASQTRWQGAQNPVTAIPLHQEAADLPETAMLCFVHLAIPGDDVYVHNGISRIIWGGQTWYGVGILGSIEAVSESLEVLAQPLKLTLSGVEPNLIADMMNVLYHGSSVTVYVGMLNHDNYDLIDTPERVWEGFIDVMYVEGGDGGTTIRVECEHRLRRQPATSRYTDEDQRSHFSTDRFFDKLHLIPGFRGTWGSRDSSYAGGGGAGGGSGGSGGGLRGGQIP